MFHGSNMPSSVLCTTDQDKPELERGSMTKPEQLARWATRELLVLIAAKRYQAEQSTLDPSRERMRTAEARWKEVEDICRKDGVNKKWEQCKKRWERLFTDFKKVYDYQKQIPAGHDGYFEMTRKERKDKRLPSLFADEWYQAMEAWVPRNKSAHPDPQQVVDSTTIEESITKPLSTPLQEDFSAPLIVNVDEDMDIQREGRSPQMGTRNLEIGGGVLFQNAHGVGGPNLDHGSNEQQPSPGRANGDVTPPLGGSTIRGWKRTRRQKSTGDLHKVIDKLVNALVEDRTARREEHIEVMSYERDKHERLIALEEKKHEDNLSQQRQAMEQAREMSREVTAALTFVGESLRYFIDRMSSRVDS
ncbi:unnamed protein product [Calypogeia fissa]